MTTTSRGARKRVPERTATVGGRQQRTDIQALRAAAVMSVVLYHLWPNRLSGGFVGVDIFFVISGFLITGHLVREVELTGRIRLAAFWAARARRLLPASLLTLLVTAVAVIVWVPRTLWEQFLSEVMASALYFQNWLLASNSVDYLAADNIASASQHFWSLSVEEQFYVFLPLLIGVGVAVAAVTRIPKARLILALLVVVTVVSFVHGVWLTSTDPGPAYFSTFTRMWEFGVGGLASFVPPAVAGLSRRRAWAYVVLTLGGVGLIAASFVVIDSGTEFPGYAAALPVAGTALVLRWGATTVVSAVGRWWPVALLGRISYAVYLWHWPILVILPFITLHALTTTEKIGILVSTVLVAWASTVLFEEPLRFRWAPRLRPVTLIGVVAAAMVPVLAVSIAGRVVVDRDRDDVRVELASVLADPPECFGAAAMDPDAPDCLNPELKGMVVPAAAEAANDESTEVGCWSGYESGDLNVCSFGPETGYDLRIAAVGDSHTTALISAWKEIAETHHWRIDVAGHVGCYWSTAARRQTSADQARTCQEWKDALSDRLSTPGAYDAVIATHATSLSIERPEDGRSREEGVVDGLVEAWTTQVPAGTRIIALVDNPQTQKTNAQCVERFGASDPDRCATPRRVGFEKFDGSAEAVKRVPTASLVDMSDFYCRSTVCPSVIGGVNVYRDRTHLTNTFVLTLAPYLGDAIESALKDQGLQ